MHSKNLLVLQHATFFCSVILLSLSQTSKFSLKYKKLLFLVMLLLTFHQITAFD